MSATFRHALPFGATVLNDGRTRFRLWAPDCGQVALCVAEGHNERVLPMGTCGGGWFELTVPRTGTGTRYRYQVKDGVRVPDPASRYQPKDVHGPSTSTSTWWHPCNAAASASFNLCGSTARGMD